MSGDGAAWIKEGLSWIRGSRYVLDYFHLSKAVTTATDGASGAYDVGDVGYLHRHQRQAVNDLFDVILAETQSGTKRAVSKASKHYNNTHWNGMINHSDPAYVGCSAEGHISHVLSDRLSSTLMG